MARNQWVARHRKRALRVTHCTHGDLIAELERQQMAPEPAPAPEQRRNHRRELLDRIATREQLIEHHDPQVRARVAAELQTLRTELERLQAEQAVEERAEIVRRSRMAAEGRPDELQDQPTEGTTTC